MAEFIENQNSSYSFPSGLHKLAKDIAIQVLWHQPKRESIYSFVAEYLKTHVVLQDEDRVAEFIVRELLDNYLTQCDTIISQRSRLSAEEEHRAAKIIQVAYRGFQARQLRPAENEYFMNYNDSLNIEALEQGETVPETYVERHIVDRDLPMDTTGWEANRHRAASVIQQKYRRISANSNRENKPPAEPQMRWRQRFAGENATCTLTVDAIEAVITTSRAAITTQEPWCELADNVVDLDETTPTQHILDLPDSDEETLSATDESSWDDLTITGTDTQSRSSMDLLETTDISGTGSIDHKTITNTHSSTYLFETTDRSNIDLLETTDRRCMDLLETTDISRTDMLDTRDRRSTDLLETTDRSRTDFLENTDRRSTVLLETTERSNTDLHETTDRRSTDLLETTDRISTDLFKTIDRSSTDLLETTDRRSTNLLETTDRRSTDLLETADRRSTVLLETTYRSNTDLLETTDRRSTDLLETTDISRTDLLANTDMITESLDALICEILNKSGQSLNFGETETQMFVESLPCDEEVVGTCGEAEQLEIFVETFHDELQVDIEKQVEERTLLDNMVEDTGEGSCVDNEIDTAAQTVKKLSADFLEAQGIISEALNVLSKSSL